MLSVCDLDPGRKNYYLARSKLEYLQGDHADGLWQGRGATALGLTGKVGEEEFCHLFDGFLRGEKLVQSAGQEDHFAGMDLCFSAPKSVSSLWAVAGPEERGAIEECQLRAVKAALDYLEEKATMVRIGKGGRERAPAGMVAALWMHGSSRAEDPDLHHHATVFNVGVTPDGKKRTTCAELYYKHKMAAGAVYRAELARLLERELALNVLRTENWFEIVGVPSQLMTRWSTRAKEIAEEALDKGLDGAREKEIAALATREPKKATPMPELFARWRKEALDYGFTQQSVPVLTQPNERDEAKETSEAVTIALQNVTRHNSHFAERDLVKEVATEAQGRGLGYRKVMEAVGTTLQNSAEVVRLGTVAGEVRFTTREVLDIEARLLSRVEAAKGKNCHKVSSANVEAAILEAERQASAKKRVKVAMTEEQRQAVYRFCRGEDGIAVLTGDAGTGKSFSLLAARRAFELEGYRCVGAALARKAALNLENEAGIKSLSVARLLKDLDFGVLDQARHHLRQMGRAAVSNLREDLERSRVGRFLVKKTPLGSYVRRMSTYELEVVEVDEKTVVFVDEAAMVGTRQMEALVSRVLERGGKVCLVGDAKQLQPIEAGQTFKAISGILGEARLTDIIRQRRREDREMVRAISRGEAQEAFKSLAERGLVHVAQSRKEAMRKMVSDWKEKGIQSPAQNLLLCSTNAERAVLNRMAQAEMKQAGKLGRKSVRVGADDIHKGDRVIFTRNSHYGVTNGSTGTVVRIGRKQITRKTFHGKQFRSLYAMLKYAEQIRKDKTMYVSVQLDDGKVVEIPLSRYQDIRLGYALNTHAAQGQTVENCLVLAGGEMTSREMVYVQASRAKAPNGTRIYTDKISAGDGLTELVRKASRSRAKDMAHDVMEDRQRKHLYQRRG
jgi:conjugative relaxase-like TrwC/TraI family protein